MTKIEMLLTILSEECNETAQRVTKAIRFGLDEVQPGQELSNLRRIFYEFSDVVATMEMMLDEYAPNRNKSDMPFINFEYIRLKKEKIEEYLLLSKKQGTLE